MAIAENLDGKHFNEPGWHREKDGKAVDKPTAIRADMETCIHNLLTLGGDVFVSWASDHLEVPDLMRVACIPEDRRNPDRPVKWTVTLNQRLQHSLSAGALGLFRHGEFRRLPWRAAGSI